MDLKMGQVTLKNGWTAVVSERQAAAMGKGMRSGFAAELNKMTEAAAEAEASTNVDLKAAYDRLSADSKAVLSRLKAGTANVAKEEWNSLRREMKETGLISKEEYFYTDPDIVVLGNAGDFMDEKGAFISGGGCTVTYEKTGRWDGYDDIKWGGDPFEYLDQWLEMLRQERDAWDSATWSDGIKMDISARTRQIEAHEKVSDLVKSLLELC